MDENNIFMLKEGDTGSNVIILQQKLKMLGYFNGSITGSFDAYTKEAITSFQEENDLNPTGIVDEETWNLLFRLTEKASFKTGPSRPTLRRGDSGEYVTQLQNRLISLMYLSGNADGNFGPATENAVKAFQINNRITADGIVGRNTWSALETLYSPLSICDGNGNGGEEIPPQNTITYTVVSGDSLYTIAKRFNTTVDELKRLNNLTSNMIYVGQQLLIPSPNTSNIIYTVVRGDSLFSIANKYNTTIDEIKRLNNLSGDTIYVNQKLLIPTVTNMTTYTVQRGDSLYTIARKFDTTINDLKRVNNLTSDVLDIGQVLKIPN